MLAQRCALASPCHSTGQGKAGPGRLAWDVVGGRAEECQIRWEKAGGGQACGQASLGTVVVVPGSGIYARLVPIGPTWAAQIVPYPVSRPKQGSVL